MLDAGFWMLDFGFWIEEERELPTNLDPDRSGLHECARMNKVVDSLSTLHFGISYTLL
jgi:hypothetical protein